MQTKLARPLIALALAGWLAACAMPAGTRSPAVPLASELLVPYVPGEEAGITPQVSAATGQGDYSLAYRLSADGRAICTRFLGPSESVGAPLRLRVEAGETWHSLVAFVPHSDYQVTLAKWQFDAEGQLTNAHVRQQPFLEWRPLGPEPGQLVTAVEWRPLVDGQGKGAWRQ